MAEEVNYYRTTEGGKSVVDNFFKKELKKLHDVKAALLAHLRILEESEPRTLREQQRVEHIRGDILCYRFQTRDHWVRILLANEPTDNCFLVLHLVVKKRNELPEEDKRLAESRLRDYRQRHERK